MAMSSVRRASCSVWGQGALLTGTLALVLVALSACSTGLPGGQPGPLRTFDYQASVAPAVPAQPQLSVLASRDDALQRLTGAGIPCTTMDEGIDATMAESQGLDGWLSCVDESYVVMIGGAFADPASRSELICGLDNQSKSVPVGANWYVRSLEEAAPSNELIAAALGGTVKTHQQICSGT